MSSQEFPFIPQNMTEYQRWLRVHGWNGYVLTKVGVDWALHTGQCDHIEGTDDLDYTKATKVCATDRASLVRYAFQATGRPPIQPCAGCGS